MNTTSGTVNTHNAGTIPAISVAKSGYIFVYCSNESILNVLFDNLQVIHTRGALVEETHYYPFGLVMSGISSKSFGSLPNKYKFGGKELQFAEFSEGNSLEQYDFGARYFDPQLGAWHSLDPKTEKFVGWSPYHYAYNNPINVIDPTGEENIVVSGGEYNDKKRYKYNFVETAIKQINDYKKTDPDEKTTWVVMNVGYSKRQIRQFEHAARRNGVSLVMADSKDELTNYINSGSTTNGNLAEARKSDPVTDLAVFGHGYASKLAFAHNQPVDAVTKEGFTFGIGDVSKLNAGAFNQAHINLYTCNPATNPADPNNYSQNDLVHAIANQTNSTVTGLWGRSDYAKINQGESRFDKINRAIWGFNPDGSQHLPQPGFKDTAQKTLSTWVTAIRFR